MAPLTCSKCQRVNPPEAEFCWFDGVFLKGLTGGPVNMATHPFPVPFVFPSGRTCRNFDELALGCYKEWPAALDMLAQGDLASFLSGMGRMDLARAARESAKAPDRDRGLDDLLSKLPSSVVEPPKLAVEPAEINLGQLRIGEDRSFTLHLENKGMRLLYGSIACKDAIWLSIGDSGFYQHKLFEFGSELSLTVRIHGKVLSARPKPLEGKLVIDSNGGNMTVVVRVDVPIKPFPEGVLAGAISPRQIAEKAKAKPREASGYFVNGDVARWYGENGWEYPVKGPVTEGAAAIQQYYEAHGLAKPPRVELSQHTLSLQGKPGEQLRCQLEVRTLEKKHVYALAKSNQPWVKIEAPTPRGQTAPVMVIVTVPERPGETLSAKVAIRANGNQQFMVPVTVSVSGNRRGAAAAAVGPAAAAAITPVLPPSRPAVTFQEPIDEPVSPLPLRTPRTHWGRHLFPAGFLLLLLLGMGVHDALVSERKPDVVNPEEPIDNTPRIALRLHNELRKDPNNPNFDPYDKSFTMPSMRFGLFMTREKDSQQRYKHLTYAERGQTNNTCLRIDDHEYLFGDPQRFIWNAEQRVYQVLKRAGRHLGGSWKEFQAPLTDDKGQPRAGYRSVWNYEEDKVLVTQTVEIVRGQVSHLFDTCVILYKIENTDTRPHRVGLRFLLDTYIGANDGVPFTVPGSRGLCDTMQEFNAAAEVPDFIQALEREDLSNPGTIANVQLRLGGRHEPPQRVTLGAWPDADLRDALKNSLFNEHMTLWNVPVVSMQTVKSAIPGKSKPADSAVVLYWTERELKPGESRDLGFAYGLGNVASEGGKLGLSVGGSLVVGGDFTVTALVSNPTADQRVTIHLPDGLQLKGSDADQPVPPLPGNATSRNSPVTWKVQAQKRGRYEIKVTSSTGASQTVKITITERSVFD